MIMQFSYLIKTSSDIKYDPVPDPNLQNRIRGSGFDKNWTGAATLEFDRLELKSFGGSRSFPSPCNCRRRREDFFKAVIFIKLS